mmetsp:Transcript_11628/g.17211  ORF Transcript_11628/g.17211 Transcript_11628/m.17211 type:complete len:151 (+) Transcript_11628:82-534(+)
MESRHPSVKFRFTVYDKNLTKRQVFEGLRGAIINSPHYELEDEYDDPDDVRYTIEANWYSPGCKWMDTMTFVINEQFNEVVVVGHSRSTNCCPSWCLIKSKVTSYSDWDKNEEHLKEVLGKVTKSYEARLVSTVGRHKTVHPPPPQNSDA